MGACASKPWEIDLRDICQRLRCFLRVVRVKSLFICLKLMAQNLNTKYKMSRKIYDPRLVWPYSLLLCGPTVCEKTTWIVELLRHHDELCTHTPKKLIWIYGVEQPDLFETNRKIWFPRQCEFVDGCPDDLLTHLEQIFEFLKTHPSMLSWTDFGEAIVVGTRFPGSNVHDMLGYLFHDWRKLSKQSPPQGLDKFIRSLFQNGFNPQNVANRRLSLLSCK